MQNERIGYKIEYTITKYADDAAYAARRPFDVIKIKKNLLLNAGITVALQLLGGIAATAFSNANARIGVGDSATAAAATQTDLLAAINKTYKAMEATYPQVSAQSVTFRSVFGSADANYAWAEWVIDNGVTALNRKVSDQGTKVSGQTWTMDATISLS